MLGHIEYVNSLSLATVYQLYYLYYLCTFWTDDLLKLCLSFFPLNLIYKQD